MSLVQGSWTKPHAHIRLLECPNGFTVGRRSHRYVCSDRSRRQRCVSTTCYNGFDKTPPKAQARTLTPDHIYSQPSEFRIGQLQVIGLGARGISATSRLLGDNLVSGADFWAVDTDGKVLASCKACNTIQLQPDEEVIGAADLQRICGSTSSQLHRIRSTGGPADVTSTGVAFLVAGAGGIPGGSPLMLQVAAHMRRQGFFVVAALTRPFDFEGRRKLEEADALVEALADVAQLTVVVPQAVLVRASSELTVKNASAIADTTLEFSMRAILRALGAPELLIVAAGTMVWHGRDLRQYNRLLAPPLERLLTCPGVGALGRGSASIPSTSLREAGLPSTLSTLAEDAVAAAAESPFLETAMGAAGAVLCVLSLPRHVLTHDLDLRPQALNDPEKYAIRAAVQVAAMTVMELAGKQCQDVVVCAHVRQDLQQQPQPEQPGNNNGSSSSNGRAMSRPAAAEAETYVCLEATLLVLEDPATVEAAAAAGAGAAGAMLRNRLTMASSSSSSRGQQCYPFKTPPPQPMPAAAGGARAGPAARVQAELGGRGGQGDGKQEGGDKKARPSWSAMSAIAGGSAGAAVRLRGQQQPGASPSGRPSSSSSSSSSSGPSSNPLLRPGFSAVSRPRQSDSRASPSGVKAQGSKGSSALPPGGEQVAAPWEGVFQHIPRMADRLVNSLVAQSLDLPPSAARWRHQQRATARANESSHKAEAWSFFGVVGLEDGEDEEGKGLVRQPVRLKDRVVGMLEAERENMAWSANPEDE